jgi:hypothetical protein
MFLLLINQSCCQFQNARNRPKSSAFSLRLRVAHELASQRPHPPTWRIADCRSESRFRLLCIHSQTPLPALTPGIIGAPLKVGPFPVFDGHSKNEESTCMSLFLCLMNGCAEFVNVVISDMNISKLTNPHRSTFFRWNNYHATGASTPLYRMSIKSQESRSLEETSKN